jgi:ribosomal protein S18 acetylase RimI-like enzyme
MTPLIRAFTAADAAACGAIVEATPLWQRYGLSGTALAEQLPTAPGKGDRVLIIETAGAVSGFAWIMPRGAFGRSAYLRLIAVAPDQRGQQLGAHLLRAVEAEAATISPDLFLFVTDFNVGAQRFYLREGFEEVGRVPDFVLPGVTELLYRKRLRA